MKKNLAKLLALLLALAMVATLFAACSDDKQETQPSSDATEPTTESTTEEPTEPVVERGPLSDYEYGTDYISLYEAIGDQVTVDMVEEYDGLAYVTVDGVEYELGEDFLSMAMVYKTEPIEGNEAFDTADEIYNYWWKLYIQRWNYLAAEIPLYSNQYYHVFNAKLQNYKVSPYWGAANAIVDATIDTSKGSNSIILGSTTDLSGSFRFATFGKNSPGASDLDIQTMSSGLGTVETDVTGAYAWNPTVVVSHEEQHNEDGSKTFTIQIADDLVFSDGSPITAKNYLVHTLVFSTPVAAEAASRDHMAGMNVVGYGDYAAATDAAVPFAGLRLIDDYTFSITIAPDYLPYYYDLTYAAASPEYLPMWLGNDCDIADDGEGAYITGDFYAKNGDSYTMAAVINANRMDITTFPYSGPYTVTSWDESALTATLALNPNFKGTPEGNKPSIETISYIKIVDKTQNEQLKKGEVDVLCDITGGDATNAALAIVEENPEAFSSTYYDRAGYGKLGFRADFGPVYFTEVRQAIMYSIDRNAFTQQFTGGYGAVVHGPYYTGSAAYLANEDTILLDSYAVSEASAIAVLEEGGWVYNAEGGEYTEGVRYKKLSKADLTEANLNYASIDGAYKTVKVGEDYYMPLVVNWFCTTDNNVSEMLKTAWAGSEITKNIGMVVQYTQGDFNTLTAELGQDPAAGYTGPALYSAFNFATGFNSAVYDFSWNWTIDPSLWDSYTYFYIKDAADFYWLTEG